MEIVVDASVFISIILNEPEKQKIIALTDGAEIIAPDTISFEICNAFTRMYKKKRLNEKQILQSFSLFNSIPLHTFTSDMTKILQLSCKYNLYAYDACYLALADRLSLSLLTLDNPMKAAARNMGIAIIEV